MSESEEEYDSDLETAINGSLDSLNIDNRLNIDIDNSIEQAIANSLMDVNFNQIHNDSFTVDVLPGIFYEGSELFHKYYGDGILLPSTMTAVIADLDISDIIVLRFVIGECECYGYISNYVDGNYAYVPGTVLGDDFMPGQMVDFEIVNRRLDFKPATKVVLKFDCDMTGIDFRVLLEPWIGKVYRCMIPGNNIYIEDGGKQYSIEICKVYNCDGECDLAVAYNTDLEIELILPPIPEPDVIASEPKMIDTPDECFVPVKLSIDELRAQRLAYFNKK
jgi:hypothetical protein